MIIETEFVASLTNEVMNNPRSYGCNSSTLESFNGIRTNQWSLMPGNILLTELWKAAGVAASFGWDSGC